MTNKWIKEEIASFSVKTGNAHFRKRQARLKESLSESLLSWSNCAACPRKSRDVFLIQRVIAVLLDKVV